MLDIADRAEAVLAAADQTADSRAAGGRYRRSLSIRLGVRYWATSRMRQREDLFGVQFHGEGLKEARRLEPAFRRAGFEARNPESSKITFAKPVPYAPDGSVDADRIEAVRRSADAILGHDSSPDTAGMSFLDFMQASPWAGVEIELPKRTLDRERPVDLDD